jgi:excisionase family DNA binding protein
MFTKPDTNGSAKAAFLPELTLTSELPALNVSVPIPTEAIVAALADSPELVNAIARLLAAQIEATEAESEQSDWLTVEEAAKYLRCKKQRIYDLTSQGRLTAVKDGSRNLYARDELNRHLDLGSYARAKRRQARYEERARAEESARTCVLGQAAGVAA